MPTQPKPLLEMKQVPVFRVHYQDMERYVRAVFGFDYDFFVATGAMPGMSPEYVVTGEDGACSVQKQANDLREGKRVKSLGVILNTLVQDRYIEAGQYIFDTKAKAHPVDVYRTLLKNGFDPTSPECMAIKSKQQARADITMKLGELDAAHAAAQKRSRREPCVTS